MARGIFGRSKSGFSLISVVVGAAILAIVTVGFTQLLSSSSRSSRKIASMVDMDMVRQSIAGFVDCEITFQAGANNSQCYDPTKVTNVTCPLTSTSPNFSGPAFRLARRTANGSVMWLTEPVGADGTTRLGNTVLKVGCSSADQSLIVKAAPFQPGQSFDWANAKTIFGSGSGLLPLCFGEPKARPNSPYYPWHNPACRWDVNKSNDIAPIDALEITNMRNAAGGDVPLTDLCQTIPPRYPDVNKNGMADSSDFNAVMAKINNGETTCP